MQFILGVNETKYGKVNRFLPLYISVNVLYYNHIKTTTALAIFYEEYPMTALRLNELETSVFDSVLDRYREKFHNKLQEQILTC